jgi:uncharacterized protein (DUF433 family)
MTLISELPHEPWRRRLFLPTYQVGEVARYADISPQTGAAWHKVGPRAAAPLSEKERRAALSYMQLIEVAVVAAARKAGVSLHRSRATRDYISKTLKSEFPFCEYRFKTDGKSLWLEYDQVEGDKGKGKLLRPDHHGQLAWGEIVGRLKEFEYEDDKFVIRWRVAGSSSPIIIDPRISFGAPTVDGTPTRVIAGRWNAGESVDDIAQDFGLQKTQVRKALEFEGLKPGVRRSKKWVH